MLLPNDKEKIVDVLSGILNGRRKRLEFISCGKPIKDVLTPKYRESEIIFDKVLHEEATIDQYREAVDGWYEEIACRLQTETLPFEEYPYIESEENRPRQTQGKSRREMVEESKRKR
jgi:hypothetical protein